MRLNLKLHPDTVCQPVSQIEAEVHRSPVRLALRYVVIGRPRELLLPATAPRRRTDRLWEHICFEAFLRAEGSDSYYEFNFSPSTEWAAYRFSGYRTDINIASEVPAPRIETDMTQSRFELRALLDLNQANLGRAPWRLGLSAVIEERNARKSYWALAHPPGKPDFHHADGFACELPEGA